MEQKKLGLIVNPVAGLGGSVGLKGSDGMVEEALARGAVPQSGNRAKVAMKELLALKDKVTLYTGPGVMGQSLAEELGFRPVVMEDSASAATTAQDTQALSRWLQEQGMDLILFAGGDGTARDICATAGEGAVFLGIPAGVKIHSPVYAKSPATAGRLAAMYLSGEVDTVVEEEVLDIDEEKYRQEIINTKLYGYLNIPGEPDYTQCRKCSSGASEEEYIEAIAQYVADKMDKDTYYIIGAGTTTRAVMRELDAEYDQTILGIQDSAEYDVLELYGGRPEWKEVLAVYAVKTNLDPSDSDELITMTIKKEKLLRDVFWDMVSVSSKVETEKRTVATSITDESGNVTEKTEEKEVTVLTIRTISRSAREMAVEYGFGPEQEELLKELLDVGNDLLWEGVSIDMKQTF